MIEHTHRPRLDQQGSYWRQKLGGVSEGEIPSDFPRLPVSSFIRADNAVECGASVLSALDSFCRHEQIPLFPVLLAAFKVLLLRYTGHDDLVVGSLSADSVRETASGQSEVFANPIGLRTDLGGDPRALECIRRVARTVEAAARHRDYPFEQLIEEIGDASPAPLFRTMLLLGRDSAVFPHVKKADLTAIEDHTARCDLVLIAAEGGGRLRLRCEYDAELFESESIRRLLGHFQIVLMGMVTDPHRPLASLPLATPAEQRQVLVEWNATQVDYPREACLHQLFEAQVERTPDTVAVVFEGQSLTYTELNKRANQLASYLRRMGVGPEVLVGLFIDRSLEMVIGLYGVLKAGGAYVPLDPEYPPDRVAFMLRDTQLGVLLTQERLRAQLPEPAAQHTAQIICLDTDWPIIAQEKVEKVNNVVSAVTADSLAYVIYTSGSTGRPKGVMNTHRGICNRLLWMQDTYQLSAADRVLQKTPFSFDVSVWEFFWPLLVGARLIVAQPGGHRDPAYLVKLIVEQGVTTLHFVPSMLQLFLDGKNVETCHSLKRVICSGEALPYVLQERFFTRLSAELHNLYGPTEAAVDVTAWACQRRTTHQLVPIGRPIANTQVYVLDADLQPLPIRVAGELYIGGAQLARGYLNRPKLTAEKFVPNPFGTDARLYQTGDRTRYLPDGNIEYLGRLDDQVKLRGFRIELGEIATVLAEHAGVRESVAVMREDGEGDKRLVAYVVPHQGQALTDEVLRGLLRDKLPEYMIPAAFVTLDSLPLTPNGKLDRRALPAPDRARTRTRTVSNAAQSEAEQRIAAVWRDVLQLDQVSIHDNFFDLGGHSLLLARVQVTLQEMFGRELSTADMFRYPTISALAKHCTQSFVEFLPTSMLPGRQSTSAASFQQTPIAIIGMVCRFPGAVDVEAYWQNLCNGVESVTFFSDSDLLVAGVDPELLQDPNYVKARAILPDSELFDAAFFGFSPREAELLDPQQRLFLEGTWQALERTGYISEAANIPIGVYAGSGMNTYLLNNLSPSRHHLGAVGAFQLMIGNDKDFLPTRVSYKLNLKGPSINVQTACSTSLVAVHMACRGLLNGECDLALAGGVSVHTPQKTGYVYQDGMILSPDGRCRAFDAQAQGTVFGSGMGIVVLKRLADAIADGDCIQAVIRGSAINNDGAGKVGYTAPSVAGQAAVIAQAQAAAGVEAETITYIEAHGTGTALGDPIEIAALTQAFRMHTQKTGFCAVGSVKTNIGHLDAAAGVAGLIKTVLALQHQTLPPSLHFSEPNPQIDFASSPFYVNTELSEWQTNGTPRRAGISSFGIGGTNCHIILEEAPEGGPAADENEIERPQHILTLSAKSPEALQQLVERYGYHLAAYPNLILADICFTANSGRTHFDHRLALIADSVAQAHEQLDSVAAGRFPSQSVSKPEPKIEPKIAFLFTGQGAQYVNMGRQLYETQPTFRRTLEQCQTLLKPYLDQPLLEVLYPQGEQISLLDETACTQPALFALEYALAELWRAWGIIPSAVFGHSVGEYVAACVAGVLSLEDALRLVATRGRLMQALPPDGMMAVVMAEEACVTAVLEPYARDVSVAAINGPHNIVISGRREAVQAVVAALQADGVKATFLNVSHAFHSPLMEPILGAFEEHVREVCFSAPQISLISNVTGALAGAELTTPEYWCQHIRQPVRFATGIQTLHEQGYNVFVEVGPQPTLLGMARQCVSEPDHGWLPTLRQGRSDWQVLLQSLGELYTRGKTVDWAEFDRDYVRHRLPLPTYPFQRQRYWVEPEAADSSRSSAFSRSAGKTAHSFIGQRLRLPVSQEIRYETRWSRHAPPYVEDHRIFGTLVVAGASHVALFLATVKEAFGADACTLEELFFLQPFTLSEQDSRVAQLVVIPQGTNQASLQFVSSLEGPEENDPAAWLVHATGKVLIPSTERTVPTTPPLDLEAVRSRCQRTLSGAEFYANIWVQGPDAGASFRWIDTIWQGDGEAVCRTELPALAEDISAYLLHPGLVEACFQLLRCCREFETAALLANGGHLYVPFSIARVHFYGRPSGQQLWCYAQIREPNRSDDQSVVGDLCLCDETGQAIAAIQGFTVRKLLPETLQRHLAEEVNDWFYQVKWQPHALAPVPLPGQESKRWLIFADQGGLGAQVAVRLRERGEQCSLVFPGEVYHRQTEDSYCIDVTAPQDFLRLLTEYTKQHEQDGAGASPSCGIVYLWSLDECSNPDLTLDTLRNAQVLGCGGVLYLVQALASLEWPESLQLWLVTQGSQPVEDTSTPVSITQAPVWGLGQVISLEHPEIRGVRIDLDPLKGADNVQALLAELWSADQEDQVAYRQGVRHIARLVRYSPQAGANRLSIDGDSSYLITGGCGALGLQVAGWLVEHGARYLILCGRRRPSEAARQTLAQLEQTGAQVHILFADVSQPAEVTRIRETVEATMPPVRGIVHAAGVLDDGILLRQNWERCLRVMAPKITGGWNLHGMTQAWPLDFFVCFSSSTAVLGSAGQANYAAANAFLDALVHYRQAQGLPGLSINWGPWAEVGMAAALGGRNSQRLRDQGWQPLSPEHGLQALGILLNQGVAQASVLPVNWPKFVRQWPVDKIPPILSDLVRPVVSSSQTSQRSTQPYEFRRHLQAAPASERQGLLLAHVESVVARILGLQPSQGAIPAQQGFAEMGMDSLMGVELRACLQDEFGLKLTPTFAFDYSNLADVTAYLSERLDLDALTSDKPLARQESKTQAEVSTQGKHLSADELERSIEEELAQLEASLQKDHEKPA